MIFGFDLDGTISAYPEQMGTLMKDLRGSGHRVLVITGCLHGAPTPVELRRQQLASFIPPVLVGEHYDELIVVQAPTWDDVPRGKGQVCRERGVAFMMDDTESWLTQIRADSPGTICLRVCP